jgi:hypothetical protein
MRNVYRILLGEPERKRDHSQTLNTNRRIILKWILEKLGLVGGGGIEFLWPRIGAGGRLL